MGSILLSVLCVITSSNPQTSAVVAVTGDVVLERGRQSYQIAAGVSLQNGDRVTVGSDATATILIDESLSVDLGAGSQVAITDDRRRRVQLQRGEARIFGSAKGTESFAAPGVGIHVAGATLRIQSTPSKSTVLVEQGHVRLYTAKGQLATLDASEAAKFTKEGMQSLTVKERLTTRWSIPEEAVRLAGVVAASRHRKLLASQPTLQAPLTDDAPEDGSALPDQVGNAAEDDDQTRGIDIQPSERPRSQESQQIRQVYHAVARATAGATSIFGGGSGSLFSGASGGLFTDAGNGTGSRFIHLVTAESEYSIDEAKLLPEDGFPIGREYWSIGIGAPPTGEVRDLANDFVDPIFTTTDPPTTRAIPHFDAYIIRLDSIIQDPVLADTQSDQVAADNLKGSPPRHPDIAGGEPLIDNQAAFNDRLTFGLGEFALATDGNANPQLIVRRSDQDREITPDPENPGDQLVALNPQVTFKTGKNAQGFQDDLPVAFGPIPRFGELNSLRRAAATVLAADQLSGFARRTGQTRFVVDGKIIDISGYRR
ncbi:MAG: FecR domain-containing protein [Pirellulales bacterium]